MTPHPMKIVGVIRSRHIGNVRGLNAWKPSHISRAKSANTHHGVFCRMFMMPGIDRGLLLELQLHESCMSCLSSGQRLGLMEMVMAWSPSSKAALENAGGPNVPLASLEKP